MVLAGSVVGDGSDAGGTDGSYVDDATVGTDATCSVCDVVV